MTELRNLGYQQGETIVYDYLRSVREQPAWQEAYMATKKRPSHGVLPLSISAHKAAWLFACNPQKLRLTQVVKLDRLRRSEEGLETAYQLAQDFRVMVTKRQEAVLDRWRNRSQGPRASCATRYAVRSALTLPYSNGQTEGQVNKLKSLKRQMYGRATFEVLRKRVLHAA